MLRHAGVVLLVGGAVALLSVWLIFEHKPGWYRPVVADEATLQRARSESAALVDSTSAKIVNGAMFEMTLSERAVNEWLAALPLLWPEARDRIPRGLSDLAVGFEEGEIHIGGHYEQGGWRVIANVGIAVVVADKGAAIEVKLVEARGGSLPMPRFLLEKILTPPLRRAHDARRANNRDSGDRSSLPQSVDSVDALFRGVSFRNRFVWPNGDRRYRIDAVTIAQHELRLRIEPL